MPVVVGMGGVGGVGLALGHQVHLADRAAARVVLPHLGVHGADVHRARRGLFWAVGGVVVVRVVVVGMGWHGPVSC